jgi:hypothetical protein
MEFQANDSRQGRKSASIVTVETFCRSQHWNPSVKTLGYYHFKSDGFAQDIT